MRTDFLQWKLGLDFRSEAFVILHNSLYHVTRIPQPDTEELIPETLLLNPPQETRRPCSALTFFIDPWSRCRVSMFTGPLLDFTCAHKRGHRNASFLALELIMHLLDL